MWPITRMKSSKRWASRPSWSRSGLLLAPRVRHRNRNRLPEISARKQFLEVADLRQVVNDDIRTVRIVDQIILVVILGRVETHVRGHGRNDRALEDLRLVELRDIG